MAEGRLHSSFDKPSKPRSKPRSPQPKQDYSHRISPPKVEDEETRIKTTPTTYIPFSQAIMAANDHRKFRRRYFCSASLSASQLSLFSVSENDSGRSSSTEEEHSSRMLSIPALSTPLPFQPSLPTITYVMSSSSVKISTEYLGKLAPNLRRHSAARPRPIEIPPEKPPLIRSSSSPPHPEKPKPKLNLLLTNSCKGDSGGNSENLIHGQLVNKQHHRMASRSRGMHLLAKMIGKELDEAKEEYFNIKQLTKEAELPSPEVCC